MELIGMLRREENLGVTKYYIFHKHYIWSRTRMENIKRYSNRKTPDYSQIIVPGIKGEGRLYKIRYPLTEDKVNDYIKHTHLSC